MVYPFVARTKERQSYASIGEQRGVVMLRPLRLSQGLRDSAAISPILGVDSFRPGVGFGTVNLYGSADMASVSICLGIVGGWERVPLNQDGYFFVPFGQTSQDQRLGFLIGSPCCWG
ncbi:MAG: hypothetical protein MRJ68_10570 [Nitrospira sp.]|nr:hypothetical protein [Nitrospira sp.]